MPTTHLGRFRLIGLIEGVSFVLLVCVGMPLKYLAELPWPNLVIGSLHGVLFVLYCWLLLRAALSRNWSLGRCLLAFAASLIPIGTFLMDRSLRRELAEEMATGSNV